MNWDRVEGNWKQFKGKVKQEWGKLTDDHLDVIAGNRDADSRARFRKPTESARTKPRSRSGSSKSGTATGRLRKTSPAAEQRDLRGNQPPRYKP